MPSISRWPEGAGILSSARDPELARKFLRFLIETRASRARFELRARPITQLTRISNSLVADLLGATLVDAQDELWAAWNALERAGSPEPAHKRLTEPPAWPPASVEKYLKREGENAMSLIETLAGELSPRPGGSRLADPELALSAAARGRRLCWPRWPMRRMASSFMNRGFARGFGPNGPRRHASVTAESRSWRPRLSHAPPPAERARSTS